MTSPHGSAVFVDPEIARSLADFPDLSFAAESLSVMRSLMPDAQAPPADLRRTEHQVGGPVWVSVHRPHGAAGALPWVYWIHGGGFVIGTRHLDDEQLERWCRTFGCACVSVDYRLAPEFPFPTALEDCLAALTWSVDHAEELGLDPHRVGIAGRSAGGGLAAAVTLALHDGDGGADGPRVGFQALDCPMLDDRQRTPSSRLAGLPVWSRESNRFGWDSYLGELSGSESVPALAAPARRHDLRGLPPAFISVGTADGFCDEDVDYAVRLVHAGVPTELHVYPGAPHGASMFPSTGLGQRMNRDFDEFVGRSVTGVRLDGGPLRTLPVD